VKIGTHNFHEIGCLKQAKVKHPTYNWCAGSHTAMYFICDTCGLIAYSFAETLSISGVNQIKSSKFESPECITCDDVIIADIIK